MMAARQINYGSIFGAYVMKVQYENVSKKLQEEREAMRTGSCGREVLEETVEDYIEQA
ncbi:hypothetical protein [Agathobacter sp.]